MSTAAVMDRICNQPASGTALRRASEVLRRASPRSRGFTLIEAMIALVIIAFGLLALAGMQGMLSRNADVAKQRTEAMRLAQERMETLRAYTAIAADPSVALAWNELDSVASDPANPLASTYSNTLFSRSWTVGGTPQDAMRPASVTVSWVDRAGETQSVTLSSVIANTDPARVGALGFPLPAGNNLRQPKNRNINIPTAALELDEGRKSVYQFRPDLAIVFNNTTGLVEERCSTLVTDAAYTARTAGCLPYRATIVAGFVTGAVLPASVPASATPQPLPVLPVGIATAAVTGEDTSRPISCAYAIAKDQNTGENLAGAHYYLCVVPITSSGGWSGRLQLAGVDASSNYKVCRIQFLPDDGLGRNQRNEQPYSNVQTSLDNQNFFIDNTAAATCTQPLPPLAGATLELHQDCRAGASPAPTAATCPPASAATPLQ